MRSPLSPYEVSEHLNRLFTSLGWELYKMRGREFIDNTKLSCDLVPREEYERFMGKIEGMEMMLSFLEAEEKNKMAQLETREY